MVELSEKEISIHYKFTWLNIFRVLNKKLLNIYGGDIEEKQLIWKCLESRGSHSDSWLCHYLTHYLAICCLNLGDVLHK